MSGFKFFASLLPELQWKIIRSLNTKTLIRLSMTSRQMHTDITTSDALQYEIDAYRAGLFQLLSPQHLTSSDIRKTVLSAHFGATRRVGPSLQITGPERPFRTICAPSPGCRCERLFRGYFAAVMEDSSLYVWDIGATISGDATSPLDLTSEKPIFELRGMEIQDVILAPEIDLIVLLCFRDDTSPSSDDESQNTTQAIVKLLQWSTLGTQPYPFFDVSEIVHEVSLSDTIAIYPGKQFLSLQHHLLALQYYIDYDYDKRRAIVWNMSTGAVVYDTERTPDPARFRHLAIISPSSFIVSTLSLLSSHDPAGAIEMHAVPSTSVPRITSIHPASELVAVFKLPNLLPDTNKLTLADFHTSEALPIDEDMGTTFPSQRVFDFPFSPLLEAGVQVVLLQYTTHSGQLDDAGKLYLTIHNRLFHRQLESWIARSQNPLRQPIVVDWLQWGPIFAHLTGYSTFSELSMTSSVCGSKICHVRLAENDEAEEIARVFIDDFNDRLQCHPRGCSGPFAHFEPHPEIPSDRNHRWTHKISTWLPFHRTTSNHFEFPDGHGLSLMTLIAPYALMTENAIVLCIRVQEQETTFTRKWWILPFVQGVPKHTQQPDQVNYLIPATPSMDWTPSTSESDCHWDWVCRICESEPLSDVHILFECKSDQRIVELRTKWLFSTMKQHEDAAKAAYEGRADEALDIAMRRSTLRPILYQLAKAMKIVYFSYPPADEGGEEEHPAVQIFRN
ncbi:hypothetical protein CPB83DRAFT_907281 [Crepidotus variabilis]|uniref:F-box domain-containing protein n=1 Tax=Crepidotus variabilis TaxID=179855 RepID=A0A9P6EEB1_9AGAR|nr:hypothetical protein CPB83DRAFT_907281 [Crepidotus variabilis]